MKGNKTILRLKNKVNTELYTLLTTGRVLYLPLRREWYEKIACGDKKEEYRDIKSYWAKRLVASWIFKGSCLGLFPNEHDTFMKDFDINKFLKFDVIVFVNGYGDVPTTIVEHKGTEIKTGREDWGAVAKRFYFTLKLGKVLYAEPCS